MFHLAFPILANTVGNVKRLILPSITVIALVHTTLVAIVRLDMLTFLISLSLVLVLLIHSSFLLNRRTPSVSVFPLLSQLLVYLNHKSCSILHIRHTHSQCLQLKLEYTSSLSQYQDQLPPTTNHLLLYL